MRLDRCLQSAQFGIEPLDLRDQPFHLFARLAATAVERDRRVDLAARLVERGARRGHHLRFAPRGIARGIIAAFGNRGRQLRSGKRARSADRGVTRACREHRQRPAQKQPEQREQQREGNRENVHLARDARAHMRHPFEPSAPRGAPGPCGRRPGGQFGGRGCDIGLANEGIDEIRKGGHRANHVIGGGPRLSAGSYQRVNHE